MEIERKYLIKELPDLAQYTSHHITQGYLNTNPVVRVREDGDKYYLTYKGKGFMAKAKSTAKIFVLDTGSEDDTVDKLNKKNIKFNIY